MDGGGVDGESVFLTVFLISVTGLANARPAKTAERISVAFIMYMCVEVGRDGEMRLYCYNKMLQRQVFCHV